MKRLSLPYYVRRSGARFESSERFLANSVVVDSTSSGEIPYVGVPMTRIKGNQYATVKDELHTFVIGDSGCGKTRLVILPSIRLFAKSKRSMVISDPKGELYKKTAGILRREGYDVQVLNFRNPSCSSRWNPLSLIEEFYHGGNEERAMLMLKDIADILRAESHSEKDTFWENAASKVFTGVALIILRFGQPGELTFENIALVSSQLVDYLNPKNEGNSRDDKAENGRNVMGENRIDFKKLFAQIPDGDPVRNNLSPALNASGGTLTSIFTVYNNMIAIYSSQESLLDLFSCSEINVADLGKKPTALYFILPDDSAVLYPIATVFIKQIYSTLINLADTSMGDGRLPVPVTFLLDEFANFAPIPQVDTMLTAARSRGITFVLVCQSMEQLENKYGSAGAEILLANCRVWIYMSSRNLNFLRRLEELVGMYTSPYTGERCPLIDMGELQHFDRGEVLILNDRCRPVKGMLPDYSEWDFGDGIGEQDGPLPQKRTDVKRKLLDGDRLVKTAAICRGKSIRAELSHKQEESGTAHEMVDKELRRRLLEQMRANCSKIHEDTKREEQGQDESKTGTPAGSTPETPGGTAPAQAVRPMDLKKQASASEGEPEKKTAAGPEGPKTVLSGKENGTEAEMLSERRAELMDRIVRARKGRQEKPGNDEE